MNKQAKQDAAADTEIDDNSVQTNRINNDNVNKQIH